MQNKPKWMNDMTIKDIEEEKLSFLLSLMEESKGKSQKEIMSFFMFKMKEAKQKNLTFSKDEIAVIIAAIKKHSTTEELHKIDEIMKKAPTS